MPESLRLDSTTFGLTPYQSYFRAHIAYTYANYTGSVVSIDECRSPESSTLVKEVTKGYWVTAYVPVTIECVWTPPLRIAPGQTHRGVFDVLASRPGTRVFGAMPLDSKPVAYRLHWVLHRGPDPSDTTAPLIHVTSSPFRLVYPVR